MEEEIIINKANEILKRKEMRRVGEDKKNMRKWVDDRRNKKKMEKRKKLTWKEETVKIGKEKIYSGNNI